MNVRRLFAAWVVALVGVVGIGCGDANPPAGQQANSNAGAPPPPPAKDAPNPSADDKPAEQTELVTVRPGIGEKGRGYGGGIISEPLHLRFTLEEKLVFDVQIKKAMQLYKAGNGGRGPESHEVFMSEIIDANNIKLPELPAGERYVYDPQTEELKFQRPVSRD